jgi:hypothetical protein
VVRGSAPAYPAGAWVPCAASPNPAGRGAARARGVQGTTGSNRPLRRSAESTQPGADLHPPTASIRSGAGLGCWPGRAVIQARDSAYHWSHQADYTARSQEGMPARFYLAPQRVNTLAARLCTPPTWLEVPRTSSKFAGQPQRSARPQASALLNPHACIAASTTQRNSQEVACARREAAQLQSLAGARQAPVHSRLARRIQLESCCAACLQGQGAPAPA